MADAAAPPNLMGYLFSRDVMQQSLRLGLVGAWDHDFPEMVEALRMLNDQCATLVQSFLPIGEQDRDEDEAHAEGYHNVLGDNEHHSAQVSISGFVLDGYFRIMASTKLMKLDPQHKFVQHLMAAYRNEYGLRVMDFGIRLLKWYRRIAYTDP